MKIIMKIIVISEGVIQGCNFGTLFFNLGYTLRVLKPAKDEFEAKGLRAVPICIHDDSAAIGEPAAVCASDADKNHATGHWQGRAGAGIRGRVLRSLYTSRIVRRMIKPR